jgi:hypothetical protein
MVHLSFIAPLTLASFGFWRRKGRLPLEDVDWLQTLLALSNSGCKLLSTTIPSSLMLLRTSARIVISRTAVRLVPKANPTVLNTSPYDLFVPCTRYCSTKGPDAAAADVGSDAAEDKPEEVEAPPSEVELLTKERDELKEELSDAKDKVLRAYAEMENVRTIAKRDVKNSKDFAVQSFAKSLLDVADNLGRAVESAPESDERSDEMSALLGMI